MSKLGVKETLTVIDKDGNEAKTTLLTIGKEKKAAAADAVPAEQLPAQIVTEASAETPAAEAPVVVESPII